MKTKKTLHIITTFTLATFLTLLLVHSCTKKEESDNTQNEEDSKIAPLRPAELIPDIKNSQDSDEEEAIPVPIVFAGCPEDAFCTEEYGKLKDSLLKMLRKIPSSKSNTEELNNFKKSSGIPISVWQKKEPEKSDIAVAWTSFCKNHQEKGVLIGGIFSKNITDINSERYTLDTVHVMFGPSSIITYKIPAKSLPIKVEDNKLIFIEELDGLYYGFAISDKGDLEIINPDRPEFFPQEIECPKYLTDAVKEHPLDPSIHTGFSCRKIYKKGDSAGVIILLPVSC